MGTAVNWLFTITFLNVVLGFIVAGILFFVSSRNTFSAKLLALFLVAINTLNLNMSLSFTDFFQNFPGLWRMLAPGSFFIGPFAYLYVRSVLGQSFRIKKTDYLFLVVPVLYMIQLYPLFLSPLSHKLEVVQGWMNDRTLLLKEPEGLLPLGWASPIRVVYNAFFQVLQFKLIFDGRKKILEPARRNKQNIEIYNWLLAFSFALSAMYVLVFVELVFHVRSVFDFHALTLMTLSLTSLFICLYLMARPNILYGLTGWLQEPERVEEHRSEESSVMASPVEPKRLTLSQEQGLAYKSAVEKHFLENQPFRRPGYALGDLSQETRIPAHLLSAFINQEYGKNFNELVNDYRVGYLEEMIMGSPDSFQYTLEALGKMAGFNSRTAFIAAVKKKTGKTPSEFFKRKGEMSPS